MRSIHHRVFLPMPPIDDAACEYSRAAGLARQVMFGVSRDELTDLTGEAERWADAPPHVRLAAGGAMARHVADLVRSGASHPDVATLWPAGARRPGLSPLADVVMAAARSELDAGRVREACLDFLALVRLGQDYGRGGSLLARFLGQELQIRAASALHDVVRGPRPPVEREGIVALLGRILERQPPVEETVRATSLTRLAAAASRSKLLEGEVELLRLYAAMQG